LRVLTLVGNVKHERDFWLTCHIPQNIDVDLLTSRRDLGLLPLLPLRVWYSGIQVLKVLSCYRNYDLTLSMNLIYGLVGAWSSFIQSFCKVKYPLHVMVDSSSLSMITSKFSLWRIIQKVFFNINKIICFTRSQANFWNNSLGYIDKAVFIPLGVDTQKYSPVNVESSNYIFSAGRTARDYVTLFKAAKHVNANFVVVGGYNTQSEIDLQSVPGNVTVHFELPEKTYRELLAKSRFVVLTLNDVSYSSGLSVLLQAMAMRKAVIVTRVCSTVDYVSDWNTGVFVKPYDEYDLRDKILYLLENQDVTEKLGFNARKDVEERFSEELMAKRFLGVFKEVLSTSN